MVNGQRLFVVALSIFVSSMMWTSPVRAQDFEMTNVSIDGGGDAATLLPGATFVVDVDYRAWSSICPTCLTELVIGTNDGSQDCAYYGIPGGPPGFSGHATVTLTAPGVPGTYELAAESFWQFTCGEAIILFGQGYNRTVIGSITVETPVATETITFSRLKCMFLPH